MNGGINWNAVYTVGAAAVIVWKLGRVDGRLHGKLEELLGKVQEHETRLNVFQRALGKAWRAISRLRGRVDTVVEVTYSPSGSQDPRPKTQAS